MKATIAMTLAIISALLLLAVLLLVFVFFRPTIDKFMHDLWSFFALPL